MIMAYNLIILVISAMALAEITQLLLSPGNDFHEILEIMEGLGVIFIGYGVVVEERASIFTAVGLYPALHNDDQEIVDHICHAYGLGYLCLGLLMEIVLYCVKLPNWLIDTEGRESPVLFIGVFMAAIVVLMMLRHVWLLLRPQAAAAH
jgi:hypothetical protein